MVKVKPALASELEWIVRNPQYYRDTEHQRLVMTRIAKRYMQKELEQSLTILLTAGTK